MLQKSTITGLIFCIGIGINSLPMLLGAILAMVSSITITKLCRYKQNVTQQGIYSFNAALVGMAILLFLPINFLSITLIISGAFLSTFIIHKMMIATPSIPALTSPFIMTTWLVLFIIELLDITITTKTTTQLAHFQTNVINDFYAIIRGISQVMLQDYWLSGTLFSIALFFSSNKAGISAVIGSASGMLVARVFNYPENFILIGSYGFNASLVAIVLTKRYENKKMPVIAAIFIIGVILSVIITRAFEQIRLPALTAPFVLSCWLIFALDHLKTKRLQSFVSTLK